APDIDEGQSTVLEVIDTRDTELDQLPDLANEIEDPKLREVVWREYEDRLADELSKVALETELVWYPSAPGAQPEGRPCWLTRFVHGAGAAHTCSINVAPAGQRE